MPHLTEAVSPVFIVGAPRSGTTLLAQLLSQHRDVFVFNETMFYDFCVAHSISPQLTDLQRKQLVSHLKERLEVRTTDSPGGLSFGSVLTRQEAISADNYFDNLLRTRKNSPRSQILSSFMESILDIKGKTVWGDKTPNHIFHLSRIRADFPNANVIHIVRNPVKFMRSYKFASRVPGVRQTTAKLYHPIITALIWKRSIKQFSRFHAEFGSQNVLEVKYEDLAEDLSEEGKRIFKLSGLDSSLADYEIRGDNSSFSQQAEQLGAMEAAVCELICHRRMSEYDYDRHTGIILRVIGIFWYTATLPFAIVRALPVISKSFGGGIFRYLRARNVF